MRLFCFTYAGGRASFFDRIDRQINASIEIVKMEYAGHGSRHRESFYRNFSELAEDMYTLIRSMCHPDDRYALMGYSMGSIVVVEVLKRILRLKEISEPAHVFLGAHEPYTRRELLDFDPSARDQWIRERTIQFGGIPKSLVNNNSFWRVYLPVYRTDYMMIADYDFEHLDLKTDVPVTVFYSETDTPLEKMKIWRRFFIGECAFFGYEGNHFFMMDHSQEMADVISGRLLSEKKG